MANARLPSATAKEADKTKTTETHGENDHGYFSGSDLTELSDDDEEDDNAVPQRMAQHAQAVPKPEPPVAAVKAEKNVEPQDFGSIGSGYSPVTVSIAELRRKYIEGYLNLNPEYQRGCVWPEARQNGLIDSILRRYFVPPIIVAQYIDEEGFERWTCIDGKQRLTAIMKFMDGELQYKSENRELKVYYQSSTTIRQAKKPVYLTRANKQRFDAYNIPVAKYENISQEQEREVFRRAQLGVQLTPAERLIAVPGLIPQLIREMRDHLKQSFHEHVGWSLQRGRDYQAVAQLVYVIAKEDKDPTPANILNWLEENIPTKQIGELRSKIVPVVQIICYTVHNLHICQPITSRKLISVELAYIGLLIHSTRDKLSLVRLAQAIEMLRDKTKEWAKRDQGALKITNALCKAVRLCVRRISSKPVDSFNSDNRGDISASQDQNVVWPTLNALQEVASTDVEMDELDVEPLTPSVKKEVVKKRKILTPEDVDLNNRPKKRVASSQAKVESRGNSVTAPSTSASAHSTPAVSRASQSVSLPSATSPTTPPPARVTRSRTTTPRTIGTLAKASAVAPASTPTPAETSVRSTQALSSLSFKKKSTSTPTSEHALSRSATPAADATATAHAAPPPLPKRVTPSGSEPPFRSPSIPLMAGLDGLDSRVPTGPRSMRNRWGPTSATSVAPSMQSPGLVSPDAPQPRTRDPRLAQRVSESPVIPGPWSPLDSPQPQFPGAWNPIVNSHPSSSVLRPSISRTPTIAPINTADASTMFGRMDPVRMALLSPSLSPQEQATPRLNTASRGRGSGRGRGSQHARRGT